VKLVCLAPCSTLIASQQQRPDPAMFFMTSDAKDSMKIARQHIVSIPRTRKVEILT